MSDFGRRLLSTVALLLGVAFLLYAHRILLVVFAGILLAVLLEGLTKVVQSFTGLRHGTGLAAVLLTLTCGGAAVAWFLGPILTEQLTQMTDQVPDAFRSLVEQLRNHPVGQIFVPETQQILTGNPDLVRRVTGVFSTTLGTVGNLLVILLTGIWIAVNPRLYIRGLFHLIPRGERDVWWTVAGSMGHALRWWLVGQFASMTVVGLLTAIGLSIAGVPIPLVLGFLAAAFSFVPYLGPIMAAVPAILVALAEGFETVLLVLIIYSGVQFLESYIVTPVIQRRAVSMPPALLIVAQVIMGYLAGVLGLFLATPLLVISTVAVQIVYVEGEIGDDVVVLGENSGLSRRKWNQ